MGNKNNILMLFRIIVILLSVGFILGLIMLDNKSHSIIANIIYIVICSFVWYAVRLRIDELGKKYFGKKFKLWNVK